MIGIAVAAFVFNTSEFMPIALLVDIAADFGVTEAQAGVLITAYAWAVCVLSLPLMVLASRFSFRRLLLFLAALFGICQVLSALAPGFWTLMAARIGVACAHAVFWSIASPAAVRVVRPEHQSLALSTIVTGSSVAMICGLPLGRVVGLALGWRMTFFCIAAVSFAVLAYLFAVFPKMAAGERFSARELPGLLKSPVLLGIYAVTALVATAYYTGYSYIEPFLQQIGGFSDGFITVALSIFGVAGIGGSMLFARLYEGERRRHAFLLAVLSGIAVSLALMVPAAASHVGVVGMCVLWGACATAFNVSLQSGILRFAPAGAAAVAMSIFSGIFNLGIGGGSAIGGAVSSAASVAWVGAAGAIIGVAGVAACALFLIPAMRRTGVTVR
ncbi:MAG: MFS transporter [Slackia sp.]|nr:MFS transporter [Slackia sp.]